MAQYYWGCSVQLWSLHITAELEGLQREAIRMLARSCHEWDNKWSLPFCDFLLCIFYLSFPSYAPSKKDLSPSHLHPCYKPLSLVSSCSPLPRGLPTLPTVQFPYPSLRGTSRFLCPLFLSLVPLPFLSSCPTAKSLALYFSNVILAHQMVVFNGDICWFGTTYLFFGQINPVKLWIRLSMITFK